MDITQQWRTRSNATLTRHYPKYSSIEGRNLEVKEKKRKHKRLSERGGTTDARFGITSHRSHIGFPTPLTLSTNANAVSLTLRTASESRERRQI